MTFLEDMRDAVTRLGVFGELDVDPAVLPSSALGLSDSSVHDLLAETAGLARQVTLLQYVLAGVASTRSGRDRGHGGLVQQTGHRNAVELLRDLTGTTRGEAIRAVKVGEALLDGAAGHGGDDADTTGACGNEADAAPAIPPWHEPLGQAVLAGAITTAQHHVIRAGLGEPPLIDGRADDDVTVAWTATAGELAREAAVCTVEDLGARARALRDLLDPVGAETRWAERFSKRSYRWSTSGDGLTQAHIVFDDEAAHWMRGLMDAALSPRRGGPRFVSADERTAADALVADPRNNEQLAYDLFLDLLRAGALASAEDVYGTREAGIRLVTVRDSVTGQTARRDVFGRLIATAHSDDGALSIPGSVLDRAMCATGTIEITVDTCGNPLDVGREQRLFTSKQRLALAVRDGGCGWPGCDRPAAHCEAHHIDHWADGGRTDCAVGILLCRYHHLHLHNNGWRITRDDAGPFLLHPPPGTGGDPVPLRSRSPLRWVFDPPPERRRWRSAA